jgi:hypothetical protein
MSEERKVLGETLTFEERLSLAQLVNQPGWKILVRLMAESCRRATEEVMKLNPSAERYPELLVGMQTTARAMHKFSAEVLDSVKLHQRTAVSEAQQRENPQPVLEGVKNRFRLPINPPEGKQ